MPPRKAKADAVKAIVKRVVDYAAESGAGADSAVVSPAPRQVPEAASDNPSARDAAPSPPSQRPLLFRDLRAVIETSAEERGRLVALLVEELSSARRPVAARMCILRVIDELFGKSRLFRDAMNDTLQSSIGRVCRGKGSNEAEICRNEVAVALLHVVHNWDVRFGEHYPMLRSVARYYRDSVRVIAVVDAEAEAPVELTDPSRARAERDRLLLLATCERAVRECKEAVSSIEQSLETAEEIFRLLFPSFEGTVTTSEPLLPASKRPRLDAAALLATVPPVEDSAFAEVEWETNDDPGTVNPVEDSVALGPTLYDSAPHVDDVASSSSSSSSSSGSSQVVQTVSSAGLGSLSYSLEIDIRATAAGMSSADTEALIEALRGEYLQLSRHAARKLSDWRDLFQCATKELSKEGNYTGAGGPHLLTLASLSEIDAIAKSLQRRVEAFLNERGHEFFDR